MSTLPSITDMVKFIVPAGSLCHVFPYKKDGTQFNHSILTQTEKRCVFGKEDVIRDIDSGSMIMSWNYNISPSCPTWLKESVATPVVASERTHSMWFELHGTVYKREGQYKGSLIHSMQIPIRQILGVDVHGIYHPVAELIAYQGVDKNNVR